MPSICPAGSVVCVGHLHPLASALASSACKCPVQLLVEIRTCQGTALLALQPPLNMLAFPQVTSALQSDPMAVYKFARTGS